VEIHFETAESKRDILWKIISGFPLFPANSAPPAASIPVTTEATQA
jgi:hypothetical protein